MRRICIIGATSTIAQATARRFAKKGASFVLVGRNATKLQSVADDLVVRGAKDVRNIVCDLLRFSEHAALIERCVDELGGLDGVLVAHGTLSPQDQCEGSAERALQEFATNCTSVISLATLLANYLEQRRGGCIAVITSVAGERGRRRNYVYGAAKGAVSLYLEGLRARLRTADVAVVDVRPGFVATPMTAGMKPTLLFAGPARVGAGIYRAMLKGKAVAYVPWFWRPIMFVVRKIPRVVFDRLNL